MKLQQIYELVISIVHNNELKVTPEEAIHNIDALIVTNQPKTDPSATISIMLNKGVLTADEIWFNQLYLRKVRLEIIAITNLIESQFSAQILSLKKIKNILYGQKEGEKNESKM